jgi:glycosyltransferase involved in cell wall biosynthesis
VNKSPIGLAMLSFYFHPSYSGSAVQAMNLAKRLAGLGVSSQVVSANLTRSLPQEVVEGLPVRRLPVAKGANLQVPSFWLSLAWTLLRGRPAIDIIHAHGTLQHTIASIVGRFLGKPTILKIAMANSDLAFERQGRLSGRINSCLVRQFDCYIATSSEVYEECLARGLEPARVHSIPNGVDTHVFAPAASQTEKSFLRKRLGLVDRPTSCFVGTLDTRKNVDGILRIWLAARRKLDSGQLILVGPRPRDGTATENRYYEGLLDFIRDHHLQDEVVLAGAQSDVASYLRCSDVFLFPSRREGMPNVLLEAMSSGLACIASRAAGASDLLHHGENGFLFDVDDEAGMGEILAKLLLHPEATEDIGAKARLTIERRFSLDVIARRYVELYRNLLAERAAKN